MIFTNYIRFCPLIWFTLIFGSYAYDLSERLEPKGALKVRLDHDLAITWPNRLKKKGKQIRRTFLWSTHLKFMNPVSEINDGQLWQMADDAYKEMQAEQKLYGVNSKKDTPKAISILAFGNEIIISSTIKGMKPFAYEYKKSAVSATLQKCQSDWAEAGGSADQRHKNQGGCSEVMSAQLYYSIYSKDDNPLSGRNARICAVVAVGDSPAERENPCGTDRTVSYESIH
jgi:hypothetical protein